MSERVPAPQPFAAVLRQFRVAAGLTQEELAERAMLSLRGVSDLERGVKTRPQRETVRLLVEGLGLEGADRAAFEEAARPRSRLAAVPASAPAASANAQTLPPTTPPTGATNPDWPATLPAPTTALVGRAEAVAAVVALLQRADMRLVTITGPGGMGKTRLGVEVAATLAGAFEGGVVFVPLATVRDAGFVPAAVAAAVGLAEEIGRTPRETVLTALREREMLLVLDNFEQITAAAGFVAALLAACPQVKLVVTSRVPLHLRSEREYPLSPLAVPEAGVRGVAEAATPAVELFVARARAAKPDFAFTDANAGAVAAICARLDGLPLAIELAAARVRLFPPAALLTRLDKPLSLLAGEDAALPPRQQTMRNAIAWSYDLLEAREQRLFRRLAVCVGGCDPDAAETLWGVGDDPTANVFGWIESLVDKHLLALVEHGDAVRLSMLETIREYGLEQLTAVSETDSVRRQHATHYHALAEQGRSALQSAEQLVWLERLETEQDNFRAALVWSREAGEIETGLGIAGSLWRFWYTRSHYDEGRMWLESLLDHDARANYPAHLTTRARALNGAGFFALAVAGDYARAEACNEEALVLWRRAGNRTQEANTLDYLAEGAKSQGDLQRARVLFDQSMALRTREGDERGTADTLCRVGSLLRSVGDHVGAVARFEEALALRRRTQHLGGTAYVLDMLGDTLRERGDYARAQVLLTESLTIHQTVGNRAGAASALTNLGLIAEYRRDYERAAERYAEALDIHRDLNDRAGLANALNTLGVIAYRQGKLAQASELCEQALAIHQEIGDERGIAFGFSYLGTFALAAGNYAGAATAFAESLTRCHAMGNTAGVMENVESLAQLAQAQGDTARAARLFGTAAHLRDTAGLALSPADADEHERVLTATRAALSPDAFAAAWTAGEATDVPALIAEGKHTSGRAG